MEVRNNEVENWGNYQHIVVRGLPFIRGESHGKQAKEKIELNINYYKSGKGIPPWTECVEFVRKNYLPALEKYFLSGLEELKGIAAGANVPFDDILILNSRYDLSKVLRNRRFRSKMQSKTEAIVTKVSEENETKEAETECTGAVVLKSGTLNQHVIIGQNWDINEFILKNDTAILLEVHPDPSENKKPLIMLAEAGTLGRSGMNQNGLGVVAMGLFSTADKDERDPGKYPSGWMPITFLRRMFLEAPNFSSGLKSILHTPKHVSCNLMIATAEDEALNIELTPDQNFIIHVPYEKEILAHSNHFKAPDFLARGDIREGSPFSSSFFRDRRVEKALLEAWPSIDELHFQNSLKDHLGYPLSVCWHSVPKDLAWTSAYPNETTVASVIYNLSTRVLKLCKGPPCYGVFKEYHLSID